MTKKTKALKFPLLVLLILVTTFVMQKNTLAANDPYCTKNISYNNTEKIFDHVFCHDTVCENYYANTNKQTQSSKELFSFYGHDASCDSFTEFCAKLDCSKLNKAQCAEKTDECIFQKEQSCKKDFPLGPAGTMKLAGNLGLNGMRTYIDGYDSFGFHWFKTGLTEPGNKAIGFKENSNDVYFGNDVFLSNDLLLEKKLSSYNKIIWQEKSLGFSRSLEYIKAESNNISFHSGSQDLLKINPDGVNIKNGLEINGNLSAGANLTWQGKILRWSPVLGTTQTAPHSSENKSVLFYCDDTNNPQSGGCL